MRWTDEDIARARSEGWTFENGYIRAVYDHDGIPHFPSVVNVLAHLNQAGRTSEWHRERFMALPWTAAADLLSVHQGWRLTLGGIIRTSTFFFESNEQAQEFVAKNAADGEPLAIKAINRLTKNRLLGRS